MIALLTLAAWTVAIVVACVVVAGLVRLRHEVRAQRARRPWEAE